MKSIFTLIFLIFISPRNILTQKYNSLEIYNTYEYYKESSIKNKRIKHRDLVESIDNIKKKGNIKSKILGKSLEGREIFHLYTGKWKTKVLLWSQIPNFHHLLLKEGLFLR